MINKVFLMGTIGERISDRVTQFGKRMLSFSLKIESNYYDKKEKTNKTMTNYIPVSYFNDEANIYPNSLVILEGKLNMRKNETGKYELQIIANNITELNTHQASTNINPIQESLEF